MSRRKQRIKALIVLVVAVMFLIITVASISAGIRAFKDWSHSMNPDREIKAVQSHTESLKNRVKSLETENRDLTIQVAELTTSLNQIKEILNECQIKEILNEWEIGEFTITAYAPFDNVSGICADENPNVTSTGQRPGPGLFAVNPEIIPYGSEIIVIGEGFVEKGIAADTGGALRVPGVYKIDLFRQTYAEAMAFGVQDAVVLFRPPNK